MKQLIEQIKKKEEVEQICKKNSFNMSLLKSLFTFRMKGFNNLEIAQKMGIHRVTVQRYTAKLQKLKESEFKKIYKYILGDNNEKTN